MANLILAFKAAQISFAKANHTAMFIFKEEESIVVCLGEERKDWGGRRETNMLNTYHELEALTYLFNPTMIIPILQMKKLRLSLPNTKQLSFVPNIGSKGHVLSINPHCIWLKLLVAAEPS